MRNTRAAAALTVDAVITEHRSLDSAIAQYAPQVDPSDRSLLMALSYGTLRWLPQCEAALAQLMKKPLRRKESKLQALLLVGLFQIRFLDVPEHAAVTTCVDATKVIGASWAKGLANGVLRNAIRNADKLWASDKDSVALAHPQWWLDQLRKSWPEHWREMATRNNRQAPMWLRVNPRHSDPASYLQMLDDEGIGATIVGDSAILLNSAMPAEALPAFAEGAVSLQDHSAQQVAALVAAEPGQRILDACAAPGGKACHLLETVDNLTLIALDSSEDRLQRVRENLDRLKLEADVCTGDASNPSDWWDGQPFDRILIDAPCSGSGVIRRHPDIKYLRRQNDIAELAKQQGVFLNALWPLLAPGGQLVYTTCSVLKQENQDVIAAFMEKTDNAEAIQLAESLGLPAGVGRQRLPGGSDSESAPDADGFFYTVLRKIA